MKPGSFQELVRMGNGSNQMPSSGDRAEPGQPARPIPDIVNDEIAQAPVTRRRLIEKIEQLLGGRTVVSYFTSFFYPVIIQDDDADMLESVLQGRDLSRGLCLILNSPGGDALAAERIIRVCRTYAGDNFDVLVPKAAKSAATMIALGAQRVLMGPTAELGPIDPQVPRMVGGQVQYMPAHAIIASYDQLLDAAVQLPPNARIEPYLLQLGQFDASEVAYFRALQSLSRDIAERSLRNGMLNGAADDAIRRCVDLFTDWNRTFAHGRAIFPDLVRQAGVAVEVIQAPLWSLVFELYIRTNTYVSMQASKTIEAADHAVGMPPPQVLNQ